MSILVNTEAESLTPTKQPPRFNFIPYEPDVIATRNEIVINTEPPAPNVQPMPIPADHQYILPIDGITGIQEVVIPGGQRIDVEFINENTDPLPNVNCV